MFSSLFSLSTAEVNKRVYLYVGTDAEVELSDVWSEFCERRHEKLLFPLSRLTQCEVKHGRCPVDLTS